jgi:predicted dehydrogenase
MGTAHSRALLALQHLDVPLRPELVSISGRHSESVERAAERWGWREALTDWREQVADDRIALFDNAGPNAGHAEPTIAAAGAGKHVLCEKPLGLSAAEAHDIWQAAERAGVHHLCGFNYRFVPAVRLARELLEAGELGEVVHFRARYLQSWGWGPTQRSGGSHARRPAAARSGISAPTSSTSPATSSARSPRSRRGSARSCRAAKSTTTSSRPSSSRTA